MERKKILVITLSLLFTLGSSLFADPCSAPWLGASHSGAPGEVNCTGCHSGSANTGPGTVNYVIGTGDLNYSPGEIYNIVLSMEQNNVNQFGFQTVALMASNNSNAGSFSLTDEETTRLLYGMGRTYVGHTICGADAEPPGSIEWSFNWQAPASDIGDIKFYLSSLETNHNHSSSGDNTYTQVLTMTYNEIILGDLDGDGTVNILDIVLEVNIILGIVNPTSQQETAGDLNADGNIDILDIILLVNIILST